MYACVGVRSSTTSGITSPTHGSKPGNVVDQSTTDNKNLKYTAAGEWAMSKMAVSEQQRRLMLTLTAQHVVWCEDVSKFIGKYGDCLTNTGDIEGNESIHSDIKVKKTEAALEERLRALLHDMNSLIDEILGPKSECGQFLSKKFKDCISAPPSPSVSMRGSRKSEYDISATNSPSRRPSTPPISGSLSRSTSSNNMKKTDKNIRKNDKKRGSGILSDGLGLSSASPSVLLLIDPSFSSLPWEGLPLIEKYFEG